MSRYKLAQKKKILGVTFDNLLKFDVHIQNAVSKANMMIGISTRTFTFLDNGTFLQLYKALINIFKFPCTTCTGNSIDKLCVNYSRTNIRKFSFSNRVPPVWNKLPELVKKALNVNTFKSAIDGQKF